MFRKLALVVGLAIAAFSVYESQAAEQHYTAPPSLNVTTKVPNQLIIVPQAIAFADGQHLYATYAVYAVQDRYFIGAFQSKNDAAFYAMTLVKKGLYAGYSYAEYNTYAVPNKTAAYGEH